MANEIVTFLLETDPEDFEIGDPGLSKEMTGVGNPHPAGSEYGQEIKQGFYKLNWHDYSDGKRIVSMYLRDRTDPDDWLHVDIMELPPEINFPAWIEATLDIFKKHPDPWGKRHYPHMADPEDFVAELDPSEDLDESRAAHEDQNDPNEYKELYEPSEKASLDQIKAAEPEFFNRENTKFFGTKKIYHYGDYIVTKNRRKRMSSVIFGGAPAYTTNFVIYRFTRTAQNPQGILLHKGEANNLRDAKAMIKTQDFRPKRERLADEIAQIRANRQMAESGDTLNGDADEDDGAYKDVYTPRFELLRDDGTFRVIKLHSGDFFLQTALENCHPKNVQISARDAKYLASDETSPQEFKLSAVMDFGCGVFQGEEDEG